MIEDRSAGPARDYRVVIGRITGTYGVRGWLRVASYTDPPGNLAGYRDWLLGPDGDVRRYTVISVRPQGKAFVAELQGIGSPELARTLVGLDVAVMRSWLADLSGDRFYWCDLIGLQVRKVDGEELGLVSQLIATGAHDVMVVEGASRMLIPFVMGTVVQNVSLKDGSITVDWEPGYA